MKFFVAFIAFGLFVSAQALTDEQKEKVKEHHKVCAPETGVDTDLVSKVRKGDFDFEDDKMNKYVVCMFKRAGLMNDSGDFLREAALEKAGDDIRDKVAKALDVCLKETGETVEKKAWNYLKCYHKERPDHAVI